MKNKVLKVGFDLDGVLLYNPARIFRPIIYFIKKYILKRQTNQFYYPKNKLEQFIWFFLHKSSLFPAKGIDEIKQLIKEKKIKVYVISARYESLKEDFLFWKKKIDPENLFSSWYYNEKNDQPHLYKEKMIKKLNLDIFVEDNWDIVKYLKTSAFATSFAKASEVKKATADRQNSKLKTGKKTKIFWIYNLFDKKIKYRYKFSSLKEVIKKIS
jgi:hypothetical protein